MRLFLSDLVPLTWKKILWKNIFDRALAQISIRIFYTQSAKPYLHMPSMAHFSQLGLVSLQVALSSMTAPNEVVHDVSTNDIIITKNGRNLVPRAIWKSHWRGLISEQESFPGSCTHPCPHNPERKLKKEISGTPKTYEQDDMGYEEKWLNPCYADF